MCVTPLICIQQRAVWDWLSEVMEESLEMKQSYGKQQCRAYNVNVYQPAPTDDGCLALIEECDEEEDDVGQKPVLAVNNDSAAFTIDDSSSQEGTASEDLDDDLL